MPNTNCLEGIKCPACGNEDSFRIAASCWVDVTDDGTSEATDFGWDDNSPIACLSCGTTGVVFMFDFTTEED